MRILLLITFSFLTSCNGNNDEKLITKSDSIVNDKEAPPILTDSVVIGAQSDAIKDIENSVGKYYFNTNTIAPSSFVNKAKQFEINVITSNCIVTKYEQHYNRTIDSLIRDKFNTTITQLIGN